MTLVPAESFYNLAGNKMESSLNSFYPRSAQQSNRHFLSYIDRSQAIFWVRVAFFAIAILLTLTASFRLQRPDMPLYFRMIWICLAGGSAYLSYYFSSHIRLGRWVYFSTLIFDLALLTYLIWSTGGLLSPLLAAVPIYTYFFIILFQNPLIILPPLLIVPILTIISPDHFLDLDDLIVLLVIYTFLNGAIITVTSFAFSKEEEQTQKIIELERKLKKMAIVDERNRLAREIHDGVGAALSGIIIQNEYILSICEKKTKLEHELVELKAIAEEAIDEIRRALAVMKDSFDFSSQIKTLHQNFINRYRIPLTISGENQIPNLTDHEKLAVFRILQECLTNIVKHAAASKASIDFCLKDTSWTILVSDNGKGFDPETTVENHYGLQNLKHRTVQIGGTINIQSRIQVGTTVNITLHLPKVNKKPMP